MNLNDRYADYEHILKESLTGDYIALAFVALVIVGGVLFILWWRHDKDDTEHSEDSKVSKWVWIFGGGLLVVALIGAVSTSVISIVRKNIDIQNRSYVVIDESFTVTEQHWWRGTKDTCTITFEQDDTTVEINPESKPEALSVGWHNDVILVYALQSEMIVDVIEK